MNYPGVHHATPTLAVFDPRGLAVRGVGYWRRSVGQTAQARVTRQVFDAAGRGVEQWDARLPIAALSHGFSLTGHVLLGDSVDAGWRVSLLGQAAETLFQWDSRGTRQDHEYDTSLRPLAVMEQARGEAVRVVERFEYGAADVEVGNQCGRLIRHDDPAGSRHMPEYDLLGLAMSEISHFLTALGTPDWPLDESARDALLETGTGLESRWRYNAVGDLQSLVDANGHRRRFSYDVAGQLKEGWLQPAGEVSPGRCLVHDIHYNPSHQVERETAGNGVVSEADYAPDDGRLLRLAAGLPGEPAVQDLRYAVDAAGNIVGIEDRALPVRFFNNQRIEALRSFGYDSLGQLISATGWEAEQAASYPMPRYRTSNDANAVVNYREEYDYDPAGNMTELRHLGAQPFTRRWAVAPNSNRSLLADDQPADFDSRFDGNGNLRFLQRGQAMTWDLRNQLASVSPVVREGADEDVERYLYGGGGRRLRKVRTALTDARTVTTEVRYLPGLEIHLHNGAPTHQVLDLEAGRNRVKWLQGLNAPEHALRYHLTDHLGSGTLELDEHANVQSREAYYPFGGTAWEDHSDQSGAWKTMRYSGKERDATGLYYYGFRYFAPWLSRWINPDPAGAVDGLNLYGFVGNSPVSFVDGGGHMKVNLNEFLASGGELQTEHERALDRSRVVWRTISNAIQPAPVLFAQPETSEVQNDATQVAPSFIQSETNELAFVDLAGGRVTPVDLQGVEVTPQSLAHQSVSVPGPSNVSPGGLSPNTCLMCSKVFANKHTLARHVKTHTGEKPYICDYPSCGEAYARSDRLSSHRRKHPGAQSFSCPWPGCEKTYAESWTLNEHYRTHTGDEPYRCPESGCNKGFGKPSQLTIHLRSHTGERPFNCETCNRAFSNKSNFTVHLRYHTGAQPYSCSVCSQTFITSAHLARHRQKMHPG